MRCLFAWLIILSATLPVQAMDQDTEDFVVSNSIAIFYHELGHALIDLLGVPVLGQEEDAADVLSILLVDQLFEAEDADRIAFDAAFSFLLDAEDSDVDNLPYWDTHGLDLQRFYTLVCLHYGADPQSRSGFADALELPADRAAYCEDERALAEESWNIYLDSADNEGKTRKWVEFGVVDPVETEAQQLMTEVVEEEVDHLNNWLELDQTLTVVTAFCDEPNAYYDPSQAAIIMCHEFADYLAEQVN